MRVISWVSRVGSGFFTKLEPLEERGRVRSQLESQDRVR